MSISTLFWSKVKKTPACWLWLGTKLGRKRGHDYGRFMVTTGVKRQKAALAHALGVLGGDPYGTRLSTEVSKATGCFHEAGGLVLLNPALAP